MGQDYEDLLLEAENSDLVVVDVNFSSNDIKGLYCDGYIGLKKGMKTTEKACILAEELGHYYTSVGDILDQSNIMNRKQEKVARRWAVEHMITPDMLINALLFGCTNRYEVADYLSITEDFLTETLSVFKRKYGSHYKGNQHTLFFTDFGYYVK